MNLGGGQVISSSPGAYIMDNAGPHPATQTARASPATVSASHPLIGPFTCLCLPASVCLLIDHQTSVCSDFVVTCTSSLFRSTVSLPISIDALFLSYFIDLCTSLI